MIPQSTTLAERLEFYEWALDMIESKENYFLCHCAERFFDVWNPNEAAFKTSELFTLFPEVCEGVKFQEDDGALWDYGSYKRIEALQKAITEVKRKIEEDGLDTFKD